MWNPETMAAQARSQAVGLVLKESALLAEAGVQAVVGTITVHSSLQGRGLFFSSPHSTLSKCKVLWTLVCSQSCAITI